MRCEEGAGECGIAMRNVSFSLCSLGCLAMSSKPTARFTINILGEDQSRSLFSVYERGNGEITLGLTSPYFDVPVEMPASEAMAKVGTFPRVGEHRYSLHPSYASTEGVNTIKQTRIAEGGQPVHSYHLTKAIKSGGNFAFLFCRRCSTLVHESAIAKTKGKSEISLGEFDPSVFSFFYAVLVSARDVEYVAPNHGPYKQINVTYFLCNNLRITVLWTFTNTPSHRSFRTYHANTEDEQNKAKFMAGNSALECADEFLNQVAILTEMLFEKIDAEEGPESVHFFREIRGLFSIGLAGYPNFWNHMQKAINLFNFREAVKKARNDREQGKSP